MNSCHVCSALSSCGQMKCPAEICCSILSRRASLRWSAKPGFPASRQYRHRPVSSRNRPPGNRCDGTAYTRSTPGRPLPVPGKELLEQSFLRSIGHLAHIRVDLGKERIEAGLGSTGLLRSGGMLDEPVLRRLEARPTWHLGGQVDLPPLRMARRLLKLVELVEEGGHEAGDPAVTFVTCRPGEYRHHVAHRDRGDRRVCRDEQRICVVRELVREIRLGKGWRKRHGQEVKAAVGGYVGEERDRRTADMDHRRDVAVLQFLDAGDLLLVLDLRLDTERIEQNLRGHGGTAAADIDIDTLAVQILDPRDVLPGEDVDLFRSE